MTRSGSEILFVLTVLALPGVAHAGDLPPAPGPHAPSALDEAIAPLLVESDAAASEARSRPGVREWLGLPERREDAFEDFARPVTNINFHHPFVRNEARPLFMYHWFPETNALDGGSLRLYAMQLHLALTDDLQFTLYKGGYVDLDAGAFEDDRGFADFAFGLKYKVWEGAETPAALAFGLGYEGKSGDREVLEGMGAGFFDVFASYARKIAPVNVIATAGVFLPRDDDEDRRLTLDLVLRF